MTKHFVLHGTAHRNTFWLDTLTHKDFQVKHVIQTSSANGATFRKQKCQRIMNFSLHLWTIFTFIKQNNIQGKNIPNTYTRTVLDICFLCILTQRLWIILAEEYWKQSMHIYIYTYIKGHEVVWCKCMLFTFSRDCDFSCILSAAPSSHI